MNHEERVSKITALQNNQNIKKLSLELDSQGFEYSNIYSLTDSIENDLWEKINEGTLINQFKEWQPKDLESIVKKNLPKESVICTLKAYHEKNFIIEFSYENIPSVFKKISSLSEEISLYTFFFFTKSLETILLISETEYQEFEVYLYKAQ